jgi:ABC-2 type transport system ATP-binding protein
VLGRSRPSPASPVVRRREVRALVWLVAVLLAYGAVLVLAEWRGTRGDPAIPTGPGIGGRPAGIDVVAGATTEILSVLVPTAPDDVTPIALDVAVSVPDGVDASRPAPAIVLLHGFASDRTSQLVRAGALVSQGYVVVMPSARGFGDSEGSITLADRDREGRDVVAIVDVLAARSDVRSDGPGDPRVALVGASYGGGLALIAAGLDPRVDAVVAATAWHDLADALAPNAAGSAGTGPLKVSWTSLLFTARTAPQDGVVDGGRCGRFDGRICGLADRAAVAGTLDRDGRSVLERAAVGGRLSPTAATLLIQGRGDTLFPVAQAFANGRELARSGAPVRLRLVAGEHGPVGRAVLSGPLAAEVDAWLARWLKDGPSGGAATDGVLVHDADGPLRTVAWSTNGAEAGTLRLFSDDDGRLAAEAGASRPSRSPGGSVELVTPAGGVPASLTVLPGLGDLGGFGDLASLVGGADVPGQAFAFETAPFERSALLLGPTTVALDVASETGELQLFARLSEVVPGGRATIVASLIAPVRVERLAAGTEATTRISLVIPDVVHRVAAGNRLRLTLSTTDQSFANLRTPGTVVLVPSSLELMLHGDGLEQLAGTASGSASSGAALGPLDAVWREAPVVVLVLLALLAGVIMASVVGLRRTARRAPLGPVEQRLARAAAGPPPIVIRGLVKDYDDGTRAVDGLDLTVEAGQVVGLLGPNGAGKTTTMRMLLGLIAPTEGSIEVFGAPMRAGHPVLERVGALVEGPGLVPDLSGRDNLVLHWRGGGRPLAEADLDWALGVADLGDAIDRPVRTYSHGMAQRVAIAQALLGRPELLVLDEPTDGLDPEQIRAMRRLLVRLGAEGHTILVSSHLLAEVEQTCTHAVVVLGGKVIAAGPVSELGERARSLVLEVDDRARARTLLAATYDGATVALEGSGLVMTLERPSQAADVVALLVGAGIRVNAASPRGTLEDAFLQLTGVDALTGVDGPAADDAERGTPSDVSSAEGVAP